MAPKMLKPLPAGRVAPQSPPSYSTGSAPSPPLPGASSVTANSHALLTPKCRSAIGGSGKAPPPPPPPPQKPGCRSATGGGDGGWTVLEQEAKGAGKGSGDPAADAMVAMQKDIKRVCAYDSDGEPIMPFVRCDFCRTTIEIWKRMHNTQGEDDQFVRMCWRCIMEEHKLPSEAESRYWIIVNSPTYAKRQKTWDAYKMAKESVQELKGVSSRSEVFAIQMQNMRELFSPMVEQLVRKAKHLELLAEKNEEYLKKMAALRT